MNFEDSPVFKSQDQCYYACLDKLNDRSMEKQNQIADNQHSFRNSKGDQSSHKKLIQDSDYKKQKSKLQNFFQDSSAKKPKMSNKKKQVKKLENDIKEFETYTNNNSNPNTYSNTNINTNSKLYQSIKSFLIVFFMLIIYQQNHFQGIKLMIKPSKTVNLCFEVLIAFFAGCEKWLPTSYDITKQRMNWPEIQKILSNNQFPSVIQNYQHYLPEIKRENYFNAKQFQEALQLLNITNKSTTIQNQIEDIISELILLYESQQTIFNQKNQSNQKMFEQEQEKLSTIQQEKNSVCSFNSQQQKEESSFEIDDFTNIDESRQVNFYQTEPQECHLSKKPLPQEKPQIIIENDDNVMKSRKNSNPKKVKDKKNTSKSPSMRMKTDSSIQCKQTPKRPSIPQQQSVKGQQQKGLMGKENQKKKNSQINLNNQTYQSIGSNVKVDVQREKAKLLKTIQQHKQKINTLQSQENQIKWQIEREVKQLAQLEEQQKLKSELEWNSQQHEKEKQLYKEKQQKAKEKLRKDNAFRQDLRNKSRSQERVINQDQQYDSKSRDASLEQLQQEVRITQSKVSEFEERVAQTKNFLCRKSKSPIKML